MNVYNVEPAEVDIYVTQGDNLALTIEVFLNLIAYIMTTSQLDMMVKRSDGTVVKTLSSVGATPLITIALSKITIKDVGFAEASTFKYDIQETLVGVKSTIIRGLIIVSEEITT